MRSLPSVGMRLAKSFDAVFRGGEIRDFVWDVIEGDSQNARQALQGKMAIERRQGLPARDNWSMPAMF